MTTWILITVRGRPELTGKCIASVLSHTPGDRKLIVVDNGSRDKTLDELYQLFRDGKIHRLICNKVDTVPQWEKSYAIAQAVSSIQMEEHDYFAWIDNDVVVKGEWLAAAQLILEQLPEVEICSLHNDRIQEARHKTVRVKKVGPYAARLKLTANGACWVMRKGFFEKRGLPPIGLGINREGTEDWFYSDQLQADGRPRFAVVEGYAEHLGYKKSLKRQVIAAEKGHEVGVDK